MKTYEIDEDGVIIEDPIDGKELVNVDEMDSALLFAKGGADPVIEEVEAMIESFVPDISTKAGRSRAASFAFKISKLKTKLDGLGKGLVSERKAELKLVDIERGRIRDKLDGMRDAVRKPVTDYENAEKQRVQEHEDRIAVIEGYKSGNYPISEDLEVNIDIYTGIIESCDEMRDYDWQEFSRRAVALIDETIVISNEHIRLAQEGIKNQKELEAFRKEKAEREQKEREEAIAKEAAGRATREAEEKAQNERQEALDRVANAERVARDAVTQVQREKDEADRAKLEADARVEREADEATRRERERVEREKQAELEKEKEREADLSHKARVNNDALLAMRSKLKDLATAEENIKLVLCAIIKGEIPGVKITY